MRRHGIAPAARQPAEEAYRAHRARIYGLCLRELRDAAAAEDVVQETFMRAAPYLGGVRDDVGAYLAVTARRLCRLELIRRRRCALTSAVDVAGVAAPGGDVESVAVTGGLLSDVWSRLSQRDRRVLAFRVYGFSLTETAHRTGMTVDAAGMALSRARRRARQLAASGRLLLPPFFAAHRLGRRPAGSAHVRAASRARGRLRSAFASAVVVIALGAGGDALHAATGWPSFGSRADTVQTPPSLFTERAVTVDPGAVPARDAGHTQAGGAAPAPSSIDVGIGDPRTPQQMQSLLDGVAQAVTTCLQAGRGRDVDACTAAVARQLPVH